MMFFLVFLDWADSEIEKLKNLERAFRSVRTRESLYLTITSFTIVKSTNFYRKKLQRFLAADVFSGSANADFLQ